MKLFLTEKKTVGDWLALALILFVVIGVFRALLQPELFYTHDTFGHALRLKEFSRELSEGQFPVRWAHQLAYRYGYPAFNYTYVLPYYLGSVLMFFGLGVGHTINLLLLGSILVSSIGWYWWLRFRFGVYASFIGTLVGLLAPYRFLMVFVTGQLGSVVGWLWIPFLLIGIEMIGALTSSWQRKLRGVLLFAFALAGVITTHIITAILVVPLLAFVVVLVGFESWQQTDGLARMQHLVKSGVFLGLAVGIGLGLAAFYWIPAVYELPLVKAGHQSIVPYYEHFPSVKQLIYSPWGYGYSNSDLNDGISFQVGFAQFAAIGLLAAVWVVGVFRAVKQDRLSQLITPAFWSILLFFGYFLGSLAISDSIWQRVSVMSVLQHPWRLLLGTTMAASIAGSIVVSQKKVGFVFGVILVALALVNTRNYHRPMELVTYSDAEVEKRNEFNQTGDIAWEFLPHSVPQPHDFPKAEVLFNPQLVSVDSLGQSLYQVNASKSAELTFSTFSFPIWHVLIDGVPTTTTADSLGRIVAKVHPGKHEVQLLRARTDTQLVAELVSIVAGLVAVEVFVVLLCRK